MKAYMPENEKWDFGLLGHQQTLDAWQGKGQNFQTRFKGSNQLG